MKLSVTWSEVTFLTQPLPSEKGKEKGLRTFKREEWTSASDNSLLKALEELPSGKLFFFVDCRGRQVKWLWINLWHWINKKSSFEELFHFTMLTTGKMKSRFSWSHTSIIIFDYKNYQIVFNSLLYLPNIQSLFEAEALPDFKATISLRLHRNKVLLPFLKELLPVKTMDNLMALLFFKLPFLSLPLSPQALLCPFGKGTSNSVSFMAESNRMFLKHVN